MNAVLIKLANPFLLGMLALGAAVAMKWRREGRSRWLLLVTLLYLGLYVYSMPATAYLVCGSLEWQLPAVQVRSVQANSIVVLGGGIVPSNNPARQSRLTSGSLWRCLRAAELYHAGPPCMLFVVGGNPDGVRGDDVSRVMADVIEKLGVPRSNLTVETESRNTIENAKIAAVLLKTANIQNEATMPAMLVTSASHLPRATRLFRQGGLHVIPVICDSRCDDFEWDWASFLPSTRAAESCSEAFREWMSTLAGWVRRE